MITPPNELYCFNCLRIAEVRHLQTLAPDVARSTYPGSGLSVNGVEPLVRAVPARDALSLRAQAVELVLVAKDAEVTELCRHGFLQALDLVVLELEDEPAFDTDEMVVVRAGDLVARLSVLELAGARDAAVEEELERAVHGRVADPRVALADAREKLVDRDVLVRAQEHVDDELALLGRVQAALAQKGRPPLLE